MDRLQPNRVKYQTKNQYYDVLKNLNRIGYYWGSVSYIFAEKLLRKKENGAFILRDSKHDSYLFTISVRSDEYVYHFRIQHVENGKFILENFSTLGAQDLISLVDTIIYKSNSGLTFYIESKSNAPSICVKFLHPVSRFKEYPVRSLQQLAKHVVLEHVRKDYIDRLVLPNRLKAYLKEHQVFD